MVKKDIYKIDNLLINVGRPLLVIFLLNISCSVDTISTGNNWVFPTIGLAAAISFLFVGYFIRRRENDTIAVWNILEHSTEVSVQELMHSTGFTRDFIQEAVKLINRHGKAYYVWNKDNDVIVDGRLRTTLFVQPSCDNCGAAVNQTINLDLNQIPICTYCGKAVSTSQINQLKSEAVDKIRVTQPIEAKKEFKLWVFILLFLFFWPAAVGYALWKADIVKKVTRQKFW